MREITRSEFRQRPNLHASRTICILFQGLGARNFEKVEGNRSVARQTRGALHGKQGDGWRDGGRKRPVAHHPRPHGNANPHQSGSAWLLRGPRPIGLFLSSRVVIGTTYHGGRLSPDRCNDAVNNSHCQSSAAWTLFNDWAR